jgi:flagellar hook protein FlgE
MALLNSLFSGVSGLRNHQAMMDVIGNNIANVNTIGYKGSRVTFSDTFNQMIRSGTNPENGAGGTNSMQVGLGMKVNSIDRNWNQGTFERTGITTDLALEGDGLFVLNNNGTQQYSRAGAFVFDADGKLVNPQNGAVVQGKVANGLGEIPSGNSIQDVIIDKNLKLAAIATGNITWGGNLESGSPTKRTDIVEMSGTLDSDAAVGTSEDIGDDGLYKIYGKDGTEYQLFITYEKIADVAGTANEVEAYEVSYYIFDKDQAPTLGVAPDLTLDPTLALVNNVGSEKTISYDPDTNKYTTDALKVDETILGENINFDLNFALLRSNPDSSDVDAKLDNGDAAEEISGSVTIYDSLGTAHNLTITYTHIDKNKWSWEVAEPANGTLSSGAKGEIKFKNNGTIDSITQNGTTVVEPNLPVINFLPESGAESMEVNLDFGSSTNGVTQTSQSSQIQSLSQDGSASASLSNLNIDKLGNIVGIFTNGNTQKLAQIMMATFTNLNGLTSIGDNMYQVAANAGDPYITEPGDTVIQSGALEQSNVDLSEEFTKMIISQRGFQANARVVTTADALLQEITNLIR